jgi:hypothetical protein
MQPADRDGEVSWFGIWVQADQFYLGFGFRTFPEPGACLCVEAAVNGEHSNFESKLPKHLLEAYRQARQFKAQAWRVKGKSVF